MTLIKESINRKENGLYRNIGDRRGKTKPKFKLGDLVRTSSTRKTFYKEILRIRVMTSIQ